MDASRRNVHENPRSKANIFAILLWTWTLKFFKTGYNKVLEPSDLYDPLATDKSDVLGDRLEREWDKELEKCKKYEKSPNFLKAIVRCFWWEFFVCGLLLVINEFVLRLGTPILLGGLLNYFRGDRETRSFDTALIFAGGICLATALNAITINQFFFGGYHIGGRIRIAVCSVVYRKALRLSMTALSDTAVGKVVNLTANDVNSFINASVLVHYIWTAPLNAVIVGYFLYKGAGYAGVIGIATVFIIVLIQSLTGKLSSIFRLQTAGKTEERVRLMNEIISGVQVIKMYAWEKPFCAMIELARRLELRVVRKSTWMSGIFAALNLFTTRMALYCTLVGMIFFGHPLSTAKVFVFASYFGSLSLTMSTLFVRAITEGAECIVAVKRLQEFLMYDELKKLENRTVSSDPNDSESTEQDLPYIGDKIVQESSGVQRNELVLVASDLIENTAKDVTSQKMMAKPSNIVVSLKSLTVKWNPKATENILEDVSADIQRGKLYIVIGAVGSGKSSLISAILGEMFIAGGRVDIKGRISYASQDAWVFGSTVRQNIIFGQPYDHQRYQSVVKACALLSDFEQFPRGDLTVVGERGSSLSGGQKARINLARSVYRGADVYILDDPLSAVDSHVGKHLFEECLQKYLAGKTRILATHQLQFIKEADAIFLLEHGKLIRFGNHVELLAARSSYDSLLTSDSVSKTGEDSVHDKYAMKQRPSIGSITSRTCDISASDINAENKKGDASTENVLEKTSRGIIKGSIYGKYFRAGGSWCYILIVIMFFILAQSFVTINDVFFPMMVDHEEKRHDRFLEDERNSTDYGEYPIWPAYHYIYIYTAIVLSILIIGVTRSFLFNQLTIGASERLHKRAFGALIRTGMRFFDTNPSGRILNRFATDLGTVDDLLPRTMLLATQNILMVAGALLVVCTVNPMFLVPLGVISVILYWIRKIYLKTSKNVKRLEGMLRSPVFTHLNATLHGLSTIRAYNAQEILKMEFDGFQDRYSSAWYMSIVTAAAFGFSLDFSYFFFTTIVTFSLLLLDGYSGSQVGLAITTAMSMAERIQWGMRWSAEADNHMMSVERVLEYTLLPPENNLRDKGFVDKKQQKLTKSIDTGMDKSPVPAPKNWPTGGSIRFRHVNMRYADDEPPVLKGLDLVIKPREKVGIVGRTGAGKSSLISALFRLARVEGVIEIDGVDTGSICLEDLRKNISIIPQDPVLFSGTLRRNLDPFDEFSDDALWAVLEEVELKDVVGNGVHGLESRVFDRGTNYSTGQRQLVCLARAILRNNKVLMLDEATANVDPHTDALIQRTIRNKFAACTVLTVAHRLNTIMDSDKVLVMDEGRLAEYDHPYILLQDQRGKFTSLVRETGGAMHDELFRVAKEAYEESIGVRL